MQRWAFAKPGGGHRVPHWQRAARQPGKLPCVGVSTVGAQRLSRISICPARAFMPSASSTTGMVRSLQQGTHQALRLRMPAQARADHSHITGAGPFPVLHNLLRQRKGHSLLALYGHDGIDFSGHPT